MKFCLIISSGVAKGGPAGAMAPPVRALAPARPTPLFIGNVYVPECQWSAEAASQYYN